MAATTTIDYKTSVTDGSNPIDKADADAPVLVSSARNQCLVPGQVLTVSATNSIAYAPRQLTPDANGDPKTVVTHAPGAWLGKSNVTAPIGSLLGVFLNDDDPQSAMAPAALDYSTVKARDYDGVTPELGQVFFIGTGVSSTGTPHAITVPQGATRLYFGVMDDYQWNNNSGTLAVTMTVKSP